MGTIRQAVLVNAIAEGMPIGKAGELAGYGSRQASSEALQNLRDKMIADLAKWGVDSRAIALKIRAKMQAKETKFFQKDGHIVTAVDVEAHGIQLQATELAVDIMGLRGNKDASVSVGTVNILWAGNAPAWHKPADIDAKANAKVSVNAMVNADNQTVIDAESVPISTLEGTGAGPGPSPHAHCQSSSKGDVLTQRIVKKRKPRLPGWRKK